MKKIIFALSIALIGSYTAATAQNYTKLSATECYNLCIAEKSNPNFIIIDIRTADEYKAGHIANALQIDYYQTDAFYAYISKLDKNKKYLIYCASAGRSGAAVAEFKKRNYNFADMIELDGGLNNWKNKGYPTTTEITAVNWGFNITAITLSPNPCKESFSISCEENFTLQIIDIIGTTVFFKSYEKGVATVSTSFATTGIYQVMIKTNNSFNISKLMIE